MQFPTAISASPPLIVQPQPPTLPIEIIDPALATTILLVCPAARYDIDLYQSNINTLLNALDRHQLQQTNNVALAKLPWITDIDLLCERGFPVWMLDWVYGLTRKYPALYLHWSSRAAISASARGDVQVLDWLSRVFGQQAIYDPQEPMRQASLQGHVHVLDWWSYVCGGFPGDSLNRYCTMLTVDEMAGRGQLDSLEWWMARGVKLEPLKDGVLNRALWAGQLRVVKWLEQRGWVEYSPQCVQRAAASGDLETLQYCMDKVMRGPQPSEASLEANGETSDGRFDSEEACPYFAAARKNHVHVLEWLLRIEYPVPEYADVLDGIAQTGSVETLKWWLDNLCVGKDMSEGVWSGLQLCSGNLAMMQLLFDRFPQAILEHAKMNIQFVPSLSRVHDKERSHINDLAVLEWWETNILRNCRLPRCKWPMLFDELGVIEACQTGNTRALEWMFAYDPYHFSVHHVGASVDVRQRILEAVGKGGYASVVDWWINQRLPFSSEDVAVVVGGAIEGGHWHFLEWLWARFSNIVQFNCSDNLPPLPMQFALDRALARSHGNVLEWVLDTFETPFTLAHECFTYGGGTAGSNPSYRANFKSVLCYSHAVAPHNVGWSCIVSLCFALIERGKARVIRDLVVRELMPRADITNEVLGYAASAGAVAFLLWWMRDDDCHDRRARRDSFLLTRLRNSAHSTNQMHVLSLLSSCFGR